MNSEDFTVKIATGKSRLDKKWRNITVSWAEFVARCSSTIRTSETMAQYLAMTKDEQGRIKDVGGFVGGWLKDGVRKRPNVEGRSLATLDLDTATATTWEDFTLLFDCEAVLYSTHTHTEAAPRYRLIIPFSRPVTVDEYQPICRAIAGEMGITQFDGTTFEEARLFYWPSTPKDGDFVFKHQEGTLCDPDKILATYGPDWRDPAKWPGIVSEGRAFSAGMKKAGDPTEKPGAVGAFCRAYTIEEAIDKFLSDVYTPTDKDDRYTYIKGSTTGGLVCYDNKFAYSNHGTDPAGGKCCNAFDLVRIHKYGSLDSSEESGNLPGTPSQKKMLEFAQNDPVTAALMARERLEEANRDFEGLTGDEEGADDSWLEDLERDKKGRAVKSAFNLELIAVNDRHFKCIYYDLFRNDFSVESDKCRFAPAAGTWVSDYSLQKMAGYTEKAYGIQIDWKNIEGRMLYAVVDKRSKDPVKDFILSAKWDGKKRLDSLVIDYLGGEDTELNRAMTRKWFIAAVKRAFSPGCKFDNVLTLQGGQGIGKSSFLGLLGGDWFTDNFSFSSEIKAQREIACSAWIIEIAELAGLRKAEVEAAKAFLSNTDDQYRKAYGKTVTHRPRHCVFAATTNEEHFLRSLTGDRRWWVIACTGTGGPSVWADRLQEERAQIWAEAYEAYSSGEQTYLPADLEAEARKMQERFNVVEEDPALSMLKEYLERLLPVDWQTWDRDRRQAFMRSPDPLDPDPVVRRDQVTADEIRQELPYKDIAHYTAQQINKMMAHVGGWERSKRHGDSRSWVRIKTEDNEDDCLE